MAGLAAAWELCQGPRPVEIVVLEGSDRVGGKLRQEQIAGHLVDVGAESMLAVRPEARDLIAHIGAAALLEAPATNAASILARGVLRPMPPGSLMGIPRSAADAAGILTAPELARLERPEPVPALEHDVSVGDYVAAVLGDAVVERLVEPLLGGVYAGHARRISLAAALPTLYAAARDARPLLPLAPASVAASSEARTGQPAAPGSPFIGLRGGVGSLPGLLASALVRRGVRIETAATVRGLAPAPGGAWELTIGATTAPRVIRADAVVLATPAAATRKLVQAFAPAAATTLAAVESASVAVVTFAFAASELPPPTGSGFLVPPIEGRSIKASTNSSSKWGWLARQAPEVTYVRASLGRHLEEATLQRPDAQLAEIARRDLGDILGRRLPVPVDWHVQRWGGGLPQYAVGHVERIELVRNEIATFHGLEVAGAAYDGVGIPAVIGSGRRAARALAEAAGLTD